MKYQIKGIMHLLGAVVLMLLILSGCNQKASAEKEHKSVNEVEEMRIHVLDIHDEIMPRIGTLMQLKRELKEKTAQLDTTIVIQQEQKEALLAAIKQLEAADEAMMQWMRTYKDPADSVSEKKALQYLKLKEQEIFEVKEKMQNSEAAAKTLLIEN